MEDNLVKVDVEQLYTESSINSMAADGNFFFWVL